MKTVWVLMLVVLISAACTEYAEITTGQEGKTQNEIPVSNTPEASRIIDEVQEILCNQGEENTQLDTVFLVEPLSEDMKVFITGSSWHTDSPVGIDELVYITVSYLDFSGELCYGDLIVHESLGEEVVEIFEELLEAKFPVASVQLIDNFEADDMRSMEANNTYAFCARLIYGSSSNSNHSYGMAIDINPVQNPYVVGETVFPEEGTDYLDREEILPGMIAPGTSCYEAFISRGWTWGGYWPSPDYQHFEKIVS